MEEQETTSRRYYIANGFRPYLNADERRHVHLVDGGVADNLGLRTILDRMTIVGSAWNELRFVHPEHSHKFVFIVVNAETEVSRTYSSWQNPPHWRRCSNPTRRLR